MFGDLLLGLFPLGTGLQDLQRKSSEYAFAILSVVAESRQLQPTTLLREYYLLKRYKRKFCSCIRLNALECRVLVRPVAQTLM